jgi:Domain of unknown function (DUF4403)
MKPKHRFFLLSILTFSLVACSDMNADKPAEESFDAPIVQEVSVLGTPVIFEIQDIEDKVNEKLAGTFFQKNGFDIPNEKGIQIKVHQLALSKPERLQINVIGNELRYTVPLRLIFDGTFGKKVGIKVEKRQKFDFALRLRFRTKILSVGEDWKLNTQTTSEGFDWIDKPDITLAGIKIGLASLAEKSLKNSMSKIEDKIDQAAHNALKLDKMIGKIWASLQKPILINKKHSKIWLRAKPQGIEMGKIEGDGTNLSIRLRILTLTETLLGENPTFTINEKLPPLKTNLAVDNQCNLHVLSELDYEEINQVLLESIGGKEFDIKGNKLLIKKAEVSGSGKNLIIKVEVGGTINATIYGKGRPVYDTIQGSLRIENFDFDVNTQEMLLGSADWLLHETAKEKIQEKLNLPIKKHLDKLPDLIRNGIAGSKLGERLELGLENMQIRPNKIAVQKEGLGVLVNVTTNLSVKLKKL